MPRNGRSQTADSTVSTEVPTLVGLLRAHAARRPDALAYTYLHDDDRRESLTFRELEARVEARAGALAREVRHGDRVLLLYPSGLEFIVAFLACLGCGIIAIPAPIVRRRGSAERLRGILTDATPAMVLTTTELIEHTRDILAGLGCTVPALASDADDRADAFGWKLPTVPQDSPAFLQYTSGSTGSPKGVVVTHRNLIENERAIRDSFGSGPDSVMVSWLPVFHDMGLVGGVLQPLHTCFHAVLMSPAAFLRRPVRWLQAVSEYRATCTGAPDFGWSLAARAISDDEKRGLDLSSLEVAYSASEPVRAETLERFTRAFAPCGFRRPMFFPGYGMAESTVFITGGPRLRDPVVVSLDAAALERHQLDLVAPGTPGARTFVGCGRPSEDVWLVIVEPESAPPAPSLAIGEIWVRSTSVSPGYWKRDEATRETFGATLPGAPAETFLRTGDLGFVLDGELFITGRLKDLIIVRGRNLYPQDVERVVESVLPFARAGAVAAFGIEAGGEEALAIVVECDRELEVAADTSAAMPANLETAAAAVTREFDVAVNAIVVVRHGTFPRTTSGKVQRGKARRLFMDQELQRIAAWPPEKAGSLPLDAERVLARIARDVVLASAGRDLGVIDPDRPLVELGMDSVAMAEYASAIEAATGRRIDADVIFEAGSIRALAAHLRVAGDAAATPAAKPRPPHPVLAHATDPPASAIPGSNAMGEGAERPRELPARHQALLQRYDRMRDAGRYFYHPIIEQQSDPWIELADRRLLMLGSYSYLGLLKHPEMVAAANDATSRFGTGAHGVRVLAGTTAQHVDLERRIAAFTGSEDAVVFSSGFVANLATITCMVGEGDVVIGDDWNHASIIDGCRMSGAKFASCAHGDLAAMEAALRDATGRHVLVVVDAVFSMEGSIVDLPAVIALCRRYGAFLMVDEAHSLGVLGRHGRGIQEHFGLDGSEIDLKMGCLSKALASGGGYVAGRRDVVRYLRHAARGYVFSSSVPAGQIAAAAKALELLVREPWRVECVRQREKQYREGLRALGFDTFQSETPIIPIATGTEEATLEMTRLCRDADLYVAPVFYPAVPMNAARLRTCVMASHSERDIAFALDVLADAGRRVGLIH